MLTSVLALAAALGLDAPDIARFGVVCQPLYLYDRGVISANLQSAIDAERHKDWPRYLAAIQKVASMQCPDGNWADLALGFFRTGRTDLALEAAERAFVVRPLATDLALHAPDGRLHPLTTAPGFAGSTLATRLAPPLAARAERIAEAKSKLDALPPALRPAERTVVEEACPGECCRLGEWMFSEKQTIYARIDDPSPSGALAAGAKVVALDGEVHVRAEPLGVGAPATDPSGRTVLQPGDLVFRLDDVGEGYTRFWIDGKVVMADSTRLEGRCLIISNECWGDFLRPTRGQAEQVWWVKVRIADGSTVWIKPAGHIEGGCSCC